MVNNFIEKEADDEESPSSTSIGPTTQSSDDDDEKDNDQNDNDDDTTTSNNNNTEKQKKINLPSIGKLLSLAKPEYPMLILAFILMIVAEGTSLYNPLLVANAYDTLVEPTTIDYDTSEKMIDINKTMILVIIIHFAGTIAGFIRGSIMGVAGERIVARLRNNLYKHILAQEIAFFDEHKTGELVSRLGSDTTLIQQATSLAVPEVCLGIVKLLVSITLMFWISPALAGTTLGFAFVIFMICVPFGSKLGTLSKKYQDVLGDAQTRSTESLGAMRTVQSFVAEEREQHRYQEKIGDPMVYKLWWPSSTTATTNNKGSSNSNDGDDNDTTYSVGFYKSLWNTGFFTIIFGVGFGSMYFSLWYGFKLVNDGTISLGDLTAFQSYIFQIGAGLGQTSRFLSQLIEARGASARVFQLLERIPTIPTPYPPIKKQSSEEEEEFKKEPSGGADDTTYDKNKTQHRQKHRWGKKKSVPPLQQPLLPTKKLDAVEGTVEFDNVFFSYPTRSNVPVLKDFSLKIARNTTAAICGPSGAGKSTVVSLLQRFYDVDSGSITLDGHDIRGLDLKFLRSQIGFVQQEPQLFGLTVRENICFGVDRPVSDEELSAICKEANALDFIMKWPDTFDTMVGERGVKMSGGQKQRIAIARALLVNPRILLLDEATSALDAESEHLVQEAIDKAVVGRTVLIVAHRLSTIKRAQQIVVLDEHKIEDVGTHDILLGRCTKYQDLIKRQSVVGISGIDMNSGEFI